MAAQDAVEIAEDILSAPDSQWAVSNIGFHAPQYDVRCQRLSTSPNEHSLHPRSCEAIHAESACEMRGRRVKEKKEQNKNILYGARHG